MSTSTTARWAANANGTCASPWPFSSSGSVSRWWHSTVSSIDVVAEDHGQRGERVGERRRPLRARSAASASSVAHRLARGLDRAAGHVGLARGRGRAGRADARVGGEHRDALDAELGARDLRLHRDEALADLGRRGVDLDERLAAVDRQAHARGRVVVEALGEADVLEADARSRRRAARPRRGSCSTTPPGSSRRSRAGRRRAGGSGIARSRSSSSATGAGPRIDLAGRQRAARAHRVAEPQLDRVHARAPRRACPSAPRARSDLHRAEAAHRAARRVVGVGDVARRCARSGTSYGPGGEGGGVRARRRSSSTRRRRRRARSARGRRRARRRASRRARSASAPGGGGRGRRTTPRGRRPSSPAGRCAARAGTRGPASRGPRGRRTRRRRRPA